MRPLAAVIILAILVIIVIVAIPRGAARGDTLSPDAGQPTSIGLSPATKSR